MRLEDCINYKDFGIYTKNDQGVLLITTVLVGFVYVVNFSTSYINSLTNITANLFFAGVCDSIREDEIGIWNSQREPDMFKDWGYIGQINDDELRDKIRERVEYVADF